MCSFRVANLGDFSPKNANLGIFLAFGELGDFRGILKISYNREFSVKNIAKNEDFSVPKHVPPYFSSYLLQDIHKFCGEFAAFWGNFMYFWGILGDFMRKFLGDFFLEFLRDFFSLSWQPWFIFCMRWA
jgi:hypothetical protein